MLQGQTNKSSYVQEETILFENDKLINYQQEVCNILNNVFVNVAKNMDENSIYISDEPQVL